MVYAYVCMGECGQHFDVIKSADQMTREELCEKCQVPAKRMFVPQKVYFSGTKAEDAEFNPGLGCVVRNKSHRKEICKEKGLEEIGNEKADTLHKHFDDRRKEKWEKTWSEVDKGWVGSE